MGKARNLIHRRPAESGAFAAGSFAAALGNRGGYSGHQLGVKVTQTGASDDTRIYGLEADYEAQEGSQLAQ